MKISILTLKGSERLYGLFTTSSLFRLILLMMSLLIMLLIMNSRLVAQEKSSSTMAAYAEKIYLQFDSKVYTNDQTIWFKSVIVNAARHTPSTLSGVLYVDLIDQNEKIIESKMVKVSKGVGDGFFELNEDLVQGLYQVRAYTEWNKNFGSDFLFKEYIHIYDVANAENVDPIRNISLKEVSDNRRRITAEISPFVTKKAEGNKLKLTIDLDGKKETILITKNKADKFLLDYPVKDESQFLRISLQTKRSQQYVKTIALNKDVVDLQFFPESGELVHGIESLVGFKALDESGKGKAVEGVIVNENDEVISIFKSNELGMGSFLFSKPDSKSSYYAQLKSKDDKSLSIQYPLPKALLNGNVLSLIYRDSIIQVVASSNYNINEAVFVRASCRGEIYFNIKGKLENGLFVLNVPKNKFPEGIIAFTMLNEKQEPVAERLAFNLRPESRLNVELSANKAIYEQRELTGLEMKTTNSKGEVVSSNLSLLVINENQLGQMQSLRQNIMSYLLLDSELKGAIENPGFYFREEGNALFHIDALLLTQGWRKYNYSKQVDKITHEPEPNLTVSGTVDSKLFGVKRKSKLTLMLEGNPPWIDQQFPDKSGIFRFNLPARYGKTKEVLLQTSNDAGKLIKVPIHVDKRSIPAIDFNQLTSVGKVDNYIEELLVSNKQRKKVEEDFPISSGEIRIEEVVVEGYDMTATRKAVMEDYGEPYKVISGEDIVEKREEWADGLYSSLMYTYPDDIIINLNQENPHGYFTASIVGGGRSTLVIIDGIAVDCYDYRYIPDISPSEITSFEIIKNAKNFGKLYREAYAADDGPIVGSIIAIYTKSGKGIFGTLGTDEAVTSHIPVFSPTKEFYAPNYNELKPSQLYKPDLRALIHWQPKIEMNKSGMASTTFFNADNVGKMKVVVEAISETGEIGYKELEYEVKQKDEVN